MWQPLRDIREQEQYGKGLLLLLGTYLLTAVSWRWVDEVAGTAFVVILLMLVANQHVPRVLRLTGFAAAAVEVVLSAIRAFSSTEWAIPAHALSTMVVGAVAPHRRGPQARSRRRGGRDQASGPTSSRRR